MGKNGCICIHIYFIPSHIRLIDGIHFIKDLTPDFETSTVPYDSSVEEEDEVPL